MSAQGILVPPGEGAVWSMAPGRSAALKLLGAETGESVMMFEETAPAGTETPLHLHHDSDEVAYVLSGEITFKIGGEVTVGGAGTCAYMPRNVPHAWKNTGAETGRVLFLYTPAAAGKLFEEQRGLQRSIALMDPSEVAAVFRRHGWEMVGPPPFE
ncbi:MAG TPA: cupin domain-containing protein [Stellaceae bacterium]|nr:cupin domain-containing protein [Stellaceae bacterium]